MVLTENNLHGYQRACISHIIQNPYCGVFLDMGLGKTVSTLTAIEQLLFDYMDISSVLVIAPKRVAESVWQEEALQWSHLKNLTFSKVIGSEKKRIEALKKKAHIYIVSRDNIAWLCAYYGSLELPFDMIVVDELSSFKSYKSVRFKALKMARPGFKRFVGLTGTPAPNGFIDLWPQIYLMDQGERLERTITNYRARYFRPEKTNGHIVYSYSLLNESEQIIKDKIADICISMQAKDYLNMPERTDNYIRLTMPEKLAKAYKTFEREKILSLDTQEVTAINAAGLSNKLLQFANGALYNENHDVHALHDIKLEALKDLIEDANGQSVLIAWTYQFDRDRIMEYLKKYKPRELKTKADIEDWNAGKVQVMLAHPASAGHGLNLQAGGNIVIWYGLTWSLELYQQFNGRLYRQGQKKAVIINHLVLSGTHDEDVVKALQNKDKKQNALLNSIKAKLDTYKKMLK